MWQDQMTSVTLSDKTDPNKKMMPKWTANSLYTGRLRTIRPMVVPAHESWFEPYIDWMEKGVLPVPSMTQPIRLWSSGHKLGELHG